MSCYVGRVGMTEIDDDKHAGTAKVIATRAYRRIACLSTSIPARHINLTIIDVNLVMKGYQHTQKAHRSQKNVWYNFFACIFNTTCTIGPAVVSIIREWLNSYTAECSCGLKAISSYNFVNHYQK